MSGRDTISDNDHSSQATASVAIPPATGAAAGNRASLVFQRLHASSVLPATASLMSPVRPAIQSPDVLPENASSRRHPEQRSLHRSKTAGGSIASSIWSHVRATTPGESAAPRTNSGQSPRSMPSAWPSGLRRASTYSMVTSSNSGESGAFGAVTAPETPTIPSMGPLGEVSDGTGDEGSVYEGAGMLSAETSPLLPPTSSAETAQRAVFKRSIKSRITSVLGSTMSGLTPEQVNVAKAVLAYSLAALVPFVPFLRDWLGDPDYMSPHLVTNATIWYHAAKTRSGLTEGGLVGIIWVFVTSCVMYIALFTGEWLHERYAVDPSAILPFGNSDDVPEALPLAFESKVVSLVVFVFGYSWCLAFFKANANRPSVGTATAICNIVLYLVMLREAPIVNYKSAAEARVFTSDGNGKVPWPFPSDRDSLAESVGKKTMHIVVAVLLGMSISMLVGWFVRPMTAGQNLRKNLRNTLTSLRDLLPQLLEPIVSDVTPSNTQQKLHGAKPEELKEGLRLHRQKLQSLKKQLSEITLEPTEWHMWARRRKLAALVACLDGLSLHLSSMSSGLELRVIDHNSDAYEGDLDTAAYSAVIQRIRAPLMTLGLVCDKTIMAVQDMVDNALDRDQQQSLRLFSSYYDGICECDDSPVHINEFEIPQNPAECSGVCDRCGRHRDYDPVTTKIMRLRAEMVDAIQAFQEDYDEAVNDLASLPISPRLRASMAGPIMDSPATWTQPPTMDSLRDGIGQKKSTTTEEQLFIVYFFVFSMREFVDELFGILPQVAAVCRPPRPFRQTFRRAMQPRKLTAKARAFVVWVVGLFWALWNTGATTELEARYEVAQFADPRSLHAPRPMTKVQRMSHAIWKACMWARRLNVKFATKYALLITILSLPCYWSMETYLEYRRQRLEWMVISAAAIMVPTVGGSALVSVYRILGTCAGGLAAFLVYEVGKDTPPLAYALLVMFSVPCFHIILNGKYPKIGQFALITFGVILINKWVAREDQMESAFSLAMRRTLSVAFGVMAGMLVTMYVWPYEARVRVRQALSWWLQTGSMLYDQLWNSLWLSYATPAQKAAAHSALQAGQAQAVSEPAEWHALTTVRDYLDNELQLQDSLMEIQTLLNDTQNEPRLKGPFPIDAYKRILNACQRVLDAMVAARWVMLPVPMVVASRLDQFPPLPPAASERPATADTTQKTDAFRGNEFGAPAPPELVVDTTELAPIERLSAADIKNQLDNCRQHRRHSSSASDEGGHGYSTFPTARRSQSRMSQSSSVSLPDSTTDSSVLESGNTTEEEEGRILLDLPIGMASTVMLEREQLELDRLVISGQHSTPHSPRLRPQSSGSVGRSSLANADAYDSDDDDEIHSHGYVRERYEGEISQRISKIVEEDLLKRTAAVREQRDALVALTMYVLASALILKTPLPAVLPPIHAAQRRVAKALSDILDPTATAVSHIAGLDSLPSDDGEDLDGEKEQIVQRAVARIRYVFYYTQVMLGWEIVQELSIVGGLMRELYGSYGAASSSLTLPR